MSSTLLLLLRARDRRTVTRVLRELERQAGDVSRTAAVLGVSPDSLYRAAARDPDGFGARFAELRQGLAGAQRAGVRARQASARERVTSPEKK